MITSENHQRCSDRKNLNFCQHSVSHWCHTISDNPTWTRNGYCSNLKDLRLHVARCGCHRSRCRQLSGNFNLRQANRVAGKLFKKLRNRWKIISRCHRSRCGCHRSRSAGVCRACLLRFGPLRRRKMRRFQSCQVSRSSRNRVWMCWYEARRQKTQNAETGRGT